MINQTLHPGYIPVDGRTTAILKQLEINEQVMREMLVELKKLSAPLDKMNERIERPAIETLKDIGKDLADNGKLDGSHKNKSKEVHK